MFDELEKYPNKGHFFLVKGVSLKEASKEVPELPRVYCVYLLSRGHIELAYIGRAGVLDKNGNLKEPLLNTCINQPEGSKGVPFLQKKASGPSVDGLDIYWYVTCDKENSDLPAFVEAMLLQKYVHIYGRLPAWNKSF